MRPVEVFPGDGPIVLGVPHAGVGVSETVRDRLNDRGAALADTDWSIDRLYRDLLPSATMVRATFHRYEIDANRDPSGVSLYPGQNTTELCPTTDFNGEPIYADGEPDAAEIEARRLAWHAPYHAALQAEIERVRAAHGVAILYDCHSIRSEAPFLFAGRLPVFSIGTNDGASCAAEVQDAVVRIAAGASGFDHVVNGRFKGGWTTRHYGRPAEGVHAIQMELAQRAYLATEDPPFAYDPEKAERVRAPLRAMLDALETLAPRLAAA